MPQKCNECFVVLWTIASVNQLRQVIFPLIVSHLGLNIDIDGNKKLSLSPTIAGCPSKTISQQLHFAIRQLSKSSSSEHQMIGPQWSFASTNNKVAFNFKESKCFVTLWLFSLTQPITVFFFSPLSSSEYKSLRIFETDLFTQNKWRATSAKQDHHNFSTSFLQKVLFGKKTCFKRTSVVFSS